MTEKKKQVKSQFSSLLKIHKDRLAEAIENNNHDKILTSEFEIRRISQLMADELSRKSKKLIEEEVEKLQEKE